MVEKSKDRKLDEDLRNWYESECLGSSAVNLAVSTGLNVTSLSKRFLPPGNTMLSYWDFNAQCSAQEIPDEAVAKCPPARA
jgi:hypothetical protein